MKSAKITQTFSGLVEWGAQGGYFKLMSTVNPVTVDLFMNGRNVHHAADVEGGHYQRVEFDRVQITTGASEAVSWLYAPQEGGSDRFTGDFTLTEPSPGVAHTPASKTAGAASAQILAANASRHYLAIQNQSTTEDVYLHTAGGPAAVGGTSFKLAPGQTWEPNVAPTGAIYAIRGAGADAALHVIEG